MSENLSDHYQHYVKPQLGQLLKILRLDKNFRKASGDKMTYTSSGKDVEVYDFLGGYGSCILGHNPDFLIKHAQAFFSEGRVTQAQASLRSESAELAKLLNQLLQAELGTRDTFVQTFASTGTEATEIAIKNAMLLWQQKKECLKKELLARSQVSPTSGEEKKQLVANLNRLDTIVPQLISLERSYHGKTASAVLSSGNDYYRKMYSSVLFESVFLDWSSELDIKLTELRSRNVEINFKGQSFFFCPFIGFIFEPIQGEGGIRPIPKECLKKIFQLTQELKIPTIADEIQSGMYRTGKLLACTVLDLQPDIILLGKSLGGGIGKISAVACRESTYVRELGMIHSSTFAEDDYSSMLAVKTLQQLDACKVDIQVRAEYFERDIKLFFEGMKQRYPKWIKDVRGVGFFIGVEFNFLENQSVPTLLYSLAVNGHASYLLMSYLLNRHHIRVGVTLSSPETIRIEPSAYVTAGAVTAMKAAFEDLIKNLDSSSLGNLFSHIFSKDEIIPNRPPLLPIFVSKPEKIKDVAFLGHIINWDHAQRLDPSLKGVKPDRLKKFFTAYAEFSQPFRYHQQIIESASGQKIRLNMYGITAVSDFFEQDIRKPMPVMMETIQDFVTQLKAESMDYLGLGQFTSIVTRNATLLDSKGISITTGNSLTAGFTIEALEEVVKFRKLDFKNLNIGVVGFAGNIGRVVTQILANHGSKLTLVYKEAYETSQRFQMAVDDLIKTTQISKSNLHLTADFKDLRSCDMIVLGTNSVQELLQKEHLKPGCIIVDISVPSNVAREVRSSKQFSYISAGLARMPVNQSINHSWVPLLSGDCFACLAETLIIGLSGQQGSFSIGDVTIDNVKLIRKLAGDCGFTVTKSL